MHQCIRWALVGWVGAGAGLWSAVGALAAEDWNACAMLQKADVDAALAPRKFDQGTPGRAVVKSSPNMAAVSSCTYTSRGATARDTVTVTLVARRAPNDASGVTPQTARDGAVKLKATPVDVDGLGAGAYWVNLGSSAFPVIELNVFRGKREWLVFSVGARTLDTQVALAGLKKIANGVAGRL